MNSDYLECILLGLFKLSLFRFRNNRKELSKIWKRNTHVGGDLRTTMCAGRERPRRISRQTFPKRTRILSIPSKPYSFHSVHSAIGSRMNGMIFRKRNSSQKNTNTVYSEYSYSGIVPKERALSKQARMHLIHHERWIYKLQSENLPIVLSYFLRL